MGPAQPADGTSAHWPGPEAEIGVPGGFRADEGLSCAAHRAFSQTRLATGAQWLMRRRRKPDVDAGLSRDFALLEARGGSSRAATLQQRPENWKRSHAAQAGKV
jgi:hypothetical protein